MKKERGGRASSGDKPDDTPIATILLVVALPEERSYFHQALTDRPRWFPTTERRRYHCTYNSRFGKVRIVIQTLDGMGQVESVLGASSAIVSVTPTLVLMVGISGSLHSSVGLGDVVVSNQVKLYAGDKVMSLAPTEGKPPKYLLCDSTKVRPPGANGEILVDRRDKFLDNSFLRYARHFIESRPTDEILSGVEPALRSIRLQGLRTTSLPPAFQQLPSTKRDRQLHMGWVLGTHNVVDSEEYKRYLQEKNIQLNFDVHRQKGEQDRVPWMNGEILAVDMESYGLIRSVELLRTTPAKQGGCPSLIGGIVVRGISDFCVGKGDLDDNTGNEIRRLAIENATNVCLTLIENLDYPELLTP